MSDNNRLGVQEWARGVAAQATTNGEAMADVSLGRKSQEYRAASNKVVKRRQKIEQPRDSLERLSSLCDYVRAFREPGTCVPGWCLSSRCDSGPKSR